jgi:DNA/RNA endonuclease G (NUC1)
MPIDSDLIVRQSLVTRYDRRTRNALWVSETLTKGGVQGPAARDNMKFQEDPAIPERFRSTLDDFR